MDAKDYAEKRRLKHHLANQKELGFTHQIYTDGSYDRRKNPSVCGYAVVFVTDETDTEYTVDIIYGVLSDSKFVRSWNVGGELYAAMIAAVENENTYHFNRIQICHDYEGVAKWVTGMWKAKTQLTQSYADFMRKKAAKNPIRFLKVQGHSGDPLNDEADYWASQLIQYGKNDDTEKRIIGRKIPKL